MADVTPADVYEAAARAFDGEGRRTVTHTHAGLRAAVDVAFAAGRAAATPDSGEWLYEVHDSEGTVCVAGVYESDAEARDDTYVYPDQWLMKRRMSYGPVEPIPAPDDNTEAGQ